MTYERHNSEPVSVGITRRVAPGKTRAFEAWLDDIKAAATSFAGYAGMDVVRPADPTAATYVIILRFDSYPEYTAWHRSAQRSDLVRRSAALTIGDATLEQAHGLEGWFTPTANRPAPTRPARYKMTILTIVGLYPLIVGVGALVGAATDFAPAIATLITVTIVAALATYVVMPSITHTAHWWLYPNGDEP